MSAYKPEVREAVVRLFLKGQTYNQIAEALNIKRGTVGGHLARWRAEGGESPDTFRCATKLGGEEEVSAQRRADRQFVRAMALAFQRGDHLPKTRNSNRPQRRQTIPAEVHDRL